jgi:hypothetical protein
MVNRHTSGELTRGKLMSGIDRIPSTTTSVR